jgi:LacI family transcriptional regulator
MEHPVKVTIADIAARSGVSPAAVSLALRNKPGVSEDTRQLILRNARDMGYFQFDTSRASTQVNVATIGLVVKSESHDSPLDGDYFYAPVIAGIESYCRQQDINLIYASLPVDEDNRPVNAPRLLKEQTADGLLLVGALLNDPMAQLINNQNVPVVLVDAYAPFGDYDAVTTDNVQGGYEATRHLIENGHKQIGIIGSYPGSYPSILERRAGYLKALAEFDLEPIFIDCQHRADETRLAMRAFLESRPRATALFGVNDEVSIAAIREAEEFGQRVPVNLSVIGFDNISLAQHVSPALTTMRVDKSGMGRLAAQLLMNRIQYPQMGRVETIMRPGLIERETVKNLSKS